jgi:hypothetical protein
MCPYKHAMYRQQNIDFVLVYLPFFPHVQYPTDRLAAILLNTMQFSYGTDI